MKRLGKALAIVTLALIIAWAAAATSDMISCSKFAEPVFVVNRNTETAENENIGTYQGLGYTIRVDRHIDADHRTSIDGTSMKLLGVMVIKRGTEAN